MIRRDIDYDQGPNRLFVEVRGKRILERSHHSHIGRAPSRSRKPMH
jgi:hypothetical protein